jgi:hypothetical protein
MHAVEGPLALEREAPPRLERTSADPAPTD